MDRDYILNNLGFDQALNNAEILFNAIDYGIVTLEELRNTGNLDASIRREITALIKQRDKKEEDFWEHAKHTEQGCKEYLTKFPVGKFVYEANNQITVFEKERSKNKKEREALINRVKMNPNSFPPDMIQEFLDNNIISKYDLLEFGIPEEVINRLNNIETPLPKLGETPDSIPDGYTEVYFWGIPGSGKTCALAAVLSTANKLGYLEIARGPGYDYMLQLQNMFSNKISILPGPSPVDTTQYLPFTLKKPDERFYRSVSLIELSGEIFQCFLYKNANKKLKPGHEKTFDSLIRFLNGKNRKIHFFFIDYNKGNKPDSDGYCQSDYLNAAATFFNDKQNNLFSKTTDAIYIVLTKSDLIPCEKSERLNHIKDHLQSNNFLAFVNSLRSKCKENSINDNRLLSTNFALGKVYFEQICEFEMETASNIIDILMRRIDPQKQSILDVFNK